MKSHYMRTILHSVKLYKPMPMPMPMLTHVELNSYFCNTRSRFMEKKKSTVIILITNKLQQEPFSARKWKRKVKKTSSRSSNNRSHIDVAIVICKRLHVLNVLCLQILRNNSLILYARMYIESCIFRFRCSV